MIKVKSKKENKLATLSDAILNASDKKIKVSKPWYKKRNLWLINFKSSNLKRVGYLYKKKTLYIEFENGSYKYKEVPIEWWIDFTNAKSKGKYFHKAKMALIHVEKL